MNAKKLKQNPDSILQIIGCILFNIAPLGIAFLVVVDIYHWFECVFIKPMFYVFTCGKQIRTISYGELGYYKMRRVAEIFAEAMPQAFVQLFILIRFRAGCPEGLKCPTLPSVLMALGSSVFVLLLWCTILKLEAKKNGMGFAEYVTVIFQGSFNFVEMLPAIERGTETGKKVNWCLYKFSDEGVGHVAKALNSPNCKLNLLKISKYTIKDLDRFGCRFFGGAIAQTEQRIEVIVSRLEEEIIALFQKYDIDNGKSLDFEEFTHLCLDIKQNMKEPCLRSDVFLLYAELADSVRNEVWQLDLQIKIKGSLEYIGLLDYSLPLQHAYEHGDLNLMSFLVAAGYPEWGEEEAAEFDYCVSDAVTSGKVREALCLCEHKGVPIVVRMVHGRDLLAMDDDGKSDPYARVSIFDQEKRTKYRKQTLNPNWDEDLLFIIPFEYMDRVLHADEFKDDDFGEDSDGDDFVYGRNEQGVTMHGGMSFAAIDVGHSVVTGLSMPQYAQDAIQSDLKRQYHKDFEFHVAGSAKQLHDVYEAAPGFIKAATTDPSANQPPSSGDLHDADAHDKHKNKNIRQFGGNYSSILKISFRIFDHDVDAEDDFMGSYREHVSMKEDTQKYHLKLSTVSLHNNQLPADTQCGDIAYTLFLNAVQIYQTHGVQYIDDKQFQDKAIGAHQENNHSLFQPAITDSKPVPISDALGVYQM